MYRLSRSISCRGNFEMKIYYAFSTYYIQIWSKSVELYRRDTTISVKISHNQYWKIDRSNLIPKIRLVDCKYTFTQQVTQVELYELCVYWLVKCGGSWVQIPPKALLFYLNFIFSYSHVAFSVLDEDDI